MTQIIVLPSAARATIVSNTSLAVSGSSADVGSSKSMIFGFMQSVIRRDDGQTRPAPARVVPVGDQKGIEFGIEAARNGKNAVGHRENHDLGVLEDIDAESESGNAWARHGLLGELAGVVGHHERT